MAKAVPIHKLTLPDAPFKASAGVIRVRLGEMMEFAPAVIDPANITELHQMRIAAKRLRYTIEVFAPVLDAAKAKDALKKVAEGQELLGAIHDCDVLVPELEAALAKEEKSEKRKTLRKKAAPPTNFAAAGILPLVARKRLEREQLYKDFIAWWQEITPEAFFAEISGLVDTTNNKAE